MVRLAGINQQLWLDEIWSVRLAQEASSFAGIFVDPALHHDNNHWLNTLYLRLIGPGNAWWRYRLLAELTGWGTVLFGWLIARRRGEWEGLAALLLLAASDFLVEFSSNARGYAPAGFFVLACVWLLEAHLSKPRRVTAALLAACGALGVLSHLTFVVILVGLIASSAIALKRRGSLQTAIAKTAIWWAVPVAIVIALYFVAIRNITVGGGPPTPDDLASEGAAMILGVPLGDKAAAVCGVFAILVCAWQLKRLWRGFDPLAAPGLLALLFVPAVLLFFPRDQYIHPRYVYVAVPLLLLVMGIELGGWFRGRAALRVAAGIVLAGLVISNGLVMSRFLGTGRGDYVGAVKYMNEHTSGPVVIVGTSQTHPTSTDMVLQYYDEYHVARTKPLMTLRADRLDWRNERPQWLIVEEDDGPQVFWGDAPFLRRAIFPSGAATSGISWTLYETADGLPHIRPENLQFLVK